MKIKTMVILKTVCFLITEDYSVRVHQIKRRDYKRTGQYLVYFNLARPSGPVRENTYVFSYDQLKRGGYKKLPFRWASEQTYMSKENFEAFIKEFKKAFGEK